MKKLHELPNSIEAEMIIIGMMLSVAEDNDMACQKLLPEDFFEPKHVLIFDALQKMYEAQKSPEIQVLIQEIKDAGQLKQVGGIAYLTECKNCSLHSYSLDEYANIVLEKSMQRELINMHQRAAREVLEGKEEVINHIASIGSEMNKIGKKKSSGDFISSNDIMTGKASDVGDGFLEVLQKRQEIRESSDSTVCLGLPTGINSLDTTLNGLLKSNLIVLAARPGVGKTALAVNFIVEIGVKKKKPVGVFSLEMAPQQLMERMASNFGNIPSQCIAKGDVKDHWVKLTECTKHFMDAPIHFYTSYSMQITSIMIAARKMKELFDIELLVIDYLQLISGSAKFKNSDSRVNEVSEISRNLKLLAMELDIPILCLSQLNRSVESRAGNKPQLSDLRESGSIEQDCDSAIFIHRPSMDNPDDGPGRINLLILKNRHGPTGDVMLAVEPQTGRYSDFSTALEIDRKKQQEEDMYFG